MFEFGTRRYQRVCFHHFRHAAIYGAHVCTVGQTLLRLATEIIRAIIHACLVSLVLVAGRLGCCLFSYSTLILIAILGRHVQTSYSRVYIYIDNVAAASGVNDLATYKLTRARIHANTNTAFENGYS